MSTSTNKQVPSLLQQQFRSGNSVSWVTAYVAVKKTSSPILPCTILTRAREAEENLNHHTPPTSLTSSSQQSTSNQLRRRYESSHKIDPDGEASLRPPATSNLPEGTKMHRNKRTVINFAPSKKGVVVAAA